MSNVLRRARRRRQRERADLKARRPHGWRHAGTDRSRDVGNVGAWSSMLALLGGLLRRRG